MSPQTFQREAFDEVCARMSEFDWHNGLPVTLGFEQAVDCFGQSVIAGVPDAADRRRDLCFCQPFGVFLSTDIATRGPRGAPIDLGPVCVDE